MTLRKTASPVNYRPEDLHACPAYNVFRRKDAPDLVCVVARTGLCRVSSRPPRGSSWAAAPTARMDLPSFCKQKAHVGSDLNGFYMFQSHGVIPRPLSMVLSRAA